MKSCCSLMGPKPSMIDVLTNRNRHRNRHTERIYYDNSQGEDGYLHAKERGLEQILLSQLFGGTNPSAPLVLEVRPLKWWDNTFLLCKSPCCGSLLWQSQETHIMIDIRISKKNKTKQNPQKATRWFQELQRLDVCDHPGNLPREDWAPVVFSQPVSSL